MKHYEQNTLLARLWIFYSNLSSTCKFGNKTWLFRCYLIVHLLCVLFEQWILVMRLSK